ncbi:MAG: tryptophan transporter [Clostridium sp.]|uniref:tryptophan transporter n=1 Tax=Clostridium sp. TaxID=1506 RepID=UPI00306DADA6
MNTKKLTMNGILLAIGAILHQITPALGLPMQPDFALAMLFIIMILNKHDYKTSMIAALITGIFASMTTKFPGGQLPNIIDKMVTANLIYILMFFIFKVKAFNKIAEFKKDNIVVLLILPIGTLISGTIFLVSAQIIVGLPAPFSALFLTVVLPTVAINLLCGMFLYKTVNLALKRSSYSTRR